jgi:hypothetical protein
MSGSLFDQIDAVMEDVIDVVNAEAFAYTPMKTRPNKEPTADGSRDSIASLQAVWIAPGQELDAGTGLARVATDRPRILVQDRFFGRPVKKGDRVIRSKDGRIYESVSVVPDGVSRTTIELVEIAE